MFAQCGIFPNCFLASGYFRTSLIRLQLLEVISRFKCARWIPAATSNLHREMQVWKMKVFLQARDVSGKLKKPVTIQKPFWCTLDTIWLIWHSEDYIQVPYIIFLKWQQQHIACCFANAFRFHVFSHAGSQQNFSQVSSLLWWIHWSQTNRCKWSYALPALCAATCRLLPCGTNGIIKADPCPRSMTATCIISDISRIFKTLQTCKWVCLKMLDTAKVTDRTLATTCSGTPGLRGGLGETWAPLRLPITPYLPSRLWIIWISKSPNWTHEPSVLEAKMLPNLLRQLGDSFQFSEAQNSALSVINARKCKSMATKTCR